MVVKLTRSPFSNGASSFYRSAAKFDRIQLHVMLSAVRGECASREHPPYLPRRPSRVLNAKLAAYPKFGSRIRAA